jgi:hypothetical protein
MQRYNDRQDLSGDLITDDLANALAMSCSRHRAFDAGLFVFAPKRGTWVAHFMEATAHYGSQHHNRPVKLPQNVAPQFLLARFAWTPFPPHQKLPRSWRAPSCPNSKQRSYQREVQRGG